MRKNNFIIVVSAPSGAGKTTIIQDILTENRKLHFVVSTTTRSMRKGEEEAKSYYFVTEKEFKDRIKNKEFLEWSRVHNNYYGVEKKEFDRIMNTGDIPLFDIDVQGAEKLKKKIKNAVYIFIIPPSINELKKRLIARGTNSEVDIAVRVNNSINEIKKALIYDYIIINQNIKDAVDDFRAIIKAEQCKRNISVIRNKKYYGEHE